MAIAFGRFHRLRIFTKHHGSNLPGRDQSPRTGRRERGETPGRPQPSRADQPNANK